MLSDPAILLLVFIQRNPKRKFENMRAPRVPRSSLQWPPQGSSLGLQQTSGRCDPHKWNTPKPDREGNLAICSTMDGPSALLREMSKQILCGFTFMWDLKSKQMDKQNRNKLVDTENTSMAARQGRDEDAHISSKNTLRAVAQRGHVPVHCSN